MTRILLALCLIVLTLPALGQEVQPDSVEEERSFFISFLENQLSTPNRQIRINGIQGVLSSEASIAEITIADREGVWLRIRDASIDWSRSTLLLRQRLQIERLAAESIEVTRRPLLEEGLPSPEARSFAIPELPIAVNLEELEVPSVSFGETVFGLESELSVEGRLRLEEGSIDTALEIVRLDGPGGQLSLNVAFDNETESLDLDFVISEPENGVLANLLDIEGRPPLSLTLAGSGPIETLDLSLALAAAGEPALSGTARFRQQQAGLGFTVDLGGPIQRLIPTRFRDFFGDESSLQASGVAGTGGGLVLDTFSLSSAALQVEAAAETASDGFLTRLSLDASIADPSGERVLLPVRGETSVQSAALAIDYGEDGSEAWNMTLDVEELVAGAFAAQNATLAVNGTAENLSVPDQRRITYDAEGAVSGIEAEQAEVAEALGRTISFESTGAWLAGEPLSLETAELAGENLSASLSGAVAEYAFQGDLALRASSIVPFSGLANRDLGGSIDLQANGELRPISGAFDLAFDGTAEELRIDNASVDPLLVGTTRIIGRLARSVNGFAADNFRIENDQITMAANGAFSSEAADFRFDATLANIDLVSDRAEGRLTATGSATGSAGNLGLSIQAEVAQGRLLDKDLTEASLAFNGTLQDEVLAGRVTGDAYLDGVRATLQSQTRIADDERRLSDLDFSAGGARITGDLLQDQEGFLTGELVIDAADISTAAALLLVEAEGSVSANLSLEPRDDGQHARLDATVNDLVTGQLSLGHGEIDAIVDDLFAVPAVEGTLEATDLSAAGIDVSTLSASAQTSGDSTDFGGQARLANGTNIAANGVLASQEGGFTLTLDEVELAQAGVEARLLQPASLTVAGDTVSFEAINLELAGGRVTAEGEIGEVLDVALTLDEVPLSIANTIRPDLSLGGTLNGEAAIGGTRTAPEASFTLTGRDIVAAALSQAGIASLAIDASGATTGDTLAVAAQIASPGGLRASVDGSVPLGNGPLDLDVDVQSFPLSLLNARMPGQDLGGVLTGSAEVTGSLADPQAAFTAEASGFTVRPLAAIGAAPLGITASGRFAGQTIILDALNATGPGGLSVAASGDVPLGATGLAVDARGTLPLSLANRLLLERGTQLTGTLTADINARGSLAAPVISGTLSTTGATVIDPMTNLRLTAINIDASLSGDTVAIRSATAALGEGGSVSLSGSVSTDAAAGFPADLALRLDDARYTDGDLITATVSGALSLTGSLTRDPLLSGAVTVNSAEIIVPDSFGGGAGSIDVQHVAPPPDVQRTLQRARADDGTPMPSGRPSVIRLNVTVDAPARIFVRGRGLDAELGGSVQLTGPITSIQPVGAFRLIRGRLSILTQRITFDEGRVTLVGNLDPFLDFVARSSGRDITVFITLSGQISDLSVEFSSQPELPEDEVLARLIFDRGVDELSPLQLAQLAAAAAELAGGSNASLLGGLREATGLDELDLITDEEGNAAVRAGRYIQENIYLGVEAGAGGTTRGTINLDVTENLRVRGGVGSGGESDVGIFFEKDY